MNKNDWAWGPLAAFLIAWLVMMLGAEADDDAEGWVLVDVVFAVTDGRGDGYHVIGPSMPDPEALPVVYRTEAECEASWIAQLQAGLSREGLVLDDRHVEGGAIVECEPDGAPIGRGTTR